MAFIERMLSRAGYTRTRQAGGTPARLVAHDDVWTIPDYTIADNQASIMQRVSWVHIAVSNVANVGASVPLSVKRRAGEDLDDVPNHPLETLLTRPNPLQSRFDLMKGTLADRALTGNAYWWLNRASENAPITEIWRIMPGRMKAVPDGQLGIRGYLYNGGFGMEEVPLESWQVAHFRDYHPLSPYVGLSPIESLVNQVTTDQKATAWNAGFFGKQNAKVAGAIAFADPVTDNEWERLTAEFRKQHGGTERNLLMLRGVGKGAVSWIPMGLSQSDMQFLEGRTFTKEEIFAIFAPGLASMLAVNATEANSTAGKATFMELAVWPILEATAQRITTDVLPVYGDDFVAEFDDVRMADRSMELAEQELYQKSHTIAEVRARWYGDDPLNDERDTLFVAEIGITGGGPTGELAEEIGDDDRPTPDLVEIAEAEAGDTPAAEADATEEPPAAKAAAPVVTLDAELDRWQRKALKRWGEGKPDKAVEFESAAIPPVLHAAIAGGLEAAQDEADVKAVFVWGLYP